MGFFKSFLVEEIPSQEEEDSFCEYENDSVNVNAELAEVNISSLISDIYNQNGLEDLSASIFRVGDMINSLPNEMATDIKKQSVIAILNNFGLSVEVVSSDGRNRLEILSGVSDKIENDSYEKISGWEKEIEEHKIAIQELERKVSDMKDQTKVSKNLISEESDRVGNLIKFIEQR